MGIAESTERAVIAIMLTDYATYDTALSEGLTESHFEHIPFKRIFREIGAIKASGGVYGPVSLGIALPDLSGLLMTISQEEYQGGVMSYLPILFRARERSILLLAVSELTRRVSLSPIDEPFDVQSAVADMLKTIEVRDTHRLWSVSAEQARVKMDEIVAARKSGEFGQDTGLTKVNAMFNGGLQPSQLITIGARPGMGKTTLALQIAIEAAASNPVGFITVEMTSDDLAASGIAYLSKIDSRQIRNGYYPHHGPEVQAAKDKFDRLPIYIFESCGDFERAQIEMRRLVKKKGCKLLVVDYLQIMRAPGRGQNRLEELTHISGSLKNMALTLGVPILACAQLNRLVEHRKDDIPRLSDFRESGSIEQDSDAVIFIQRATTDSPKCAVDLVIAKNRRGGTGIVKCSGDYATGRIWEI